MFEKIVVGFDESRGSRDALALAAVLGGRFGSEITVATVVPSPVGGAFAPALPADAYTAVRSEAEASADRAAGEVGGNSVVVEALSPARGLDEVVEQTAADLLVLGCGKGDPGEVRAGHKARHMLQGGTAAVLLAPVGFAEGSVAGTALERVGIAVDGSTESEEALRVAAALAGKEPVQLISVATDFAEYWGHWGATYAMAELAEASREAARNVLDAASKDLPPEISHQEVLLEGDAAAELRRRSSEEMDLLCLGSRSFGPLRRVLLGSVSSDVVAHAGCAILVVPRPGD